MIISFNKPDKFGIAASILCFIHCLVTPLFFVAQTSSLQMSKSSPFWWQNMDVLFLCIGFFAIYKTSKKSSNKSIKILLWYNWLRLLLMVMNEKFEIIHIPELLMYGTSLSLAGIHIYNLKYCKCKEDRCCASKHL